MLYSFSINSFNNRNILTARVLAFNPYVNREVRNHRLQQIQWISLFIYV